MIDPAVAIRGLLADSHFKHVEAHCDECRRRLNPNGQSGPRLCVYCNLKSKQEFDACYADWQSQERRKKIHIVKLP